MAVTRHLLIRGLVQGVGYREALRQEALARGCTGWVRNRRDGSVEAFLQGEPAAVEAIVAWAWQGPPAARVVEVRIAHDAEVDARPLTGFDRLPTA